LDAKIAKSQLQPSQYDVGVDWNNFTPISFREVLEKIKYQKKHNVNMYESFVRMASSSDSPVGDSVLSK
jgi:hypothetical protein